MIEFDDSMFADVREAIKEKKNTNSMFSNILKFAAPDKEGETVTYTVRLLPNVKDPKRTFFKYITYDWNSLSTGKWIRVVSPVTFGERCPIQEAKNKAFNSKTSTEEEIEKARLLKRKEHWLINVYVIDDPKNPQNNGTVKIIDIGKQIYNKIANVSDEDDKDSYLGNDIFLKPKDSTGFNLKIVVKKEAQFPNYNSSEFSRKEVPIDGVGNNAEAIAEIYNQTFDLKTINPIKSYEEIEEILNEHFFVDIEKIANKPEPAMKQSDVDIDKLINEKTSDPEPAKSINDVDDEFLNSILNDSSKK